MKELSRKGRRSERKDEFSECNNLVEGLVREQLPPSGLSRVPLNSLIVLSYHGQCPPPACPNLQSTPTPRKVQNSLG